MHELPSVRFTMAKKCSQKGEVALAQVADGGSDEAGAVAAHSSGEAPVRQDGEGQAPPPPSLPQAAWAATSESVAAADEGVRETADGEEESPQGGQAAGGEEGAEERNAQVETTSHSHEPVQDGLVSGTASTPLSPPAVPSLRLPASESVSARGKGDGAGGSASHRKEGGHPDPVLERAERAMNMLDDYIMKKSPQKTDPVLERAERGLHMHLNV